MVDESSLASTRQMQAFMEKIGPQDRVLLIGDTRQHQSVDAGKPFEQMQQAGMQTSRLDQIMRQKDPELLRAVEHLSRNETGIGLTLLQQQGRVTEIPDNVQRIEAIAKDYVAKPENTLVVSPDNASRQEINNAIRTELQASAVVSQENHSMKVLTPRSDMTSVDRSWAARYQPDDVLHYTRGSKEHGIEKASYATVVSANHKENLITVQKQDGQQATYDPKRLQGIAAYREIDRDFAQGDRIQFTANNRELAVSNRDLGTIERIDSNQVSVKMDGAKERTVSFDAAQLRHFDHGYAVTSHSSQGLTADRVLVNMDTKVHPDLINTRFAYVSVSRASEDVRIYTNDVAILSERLSTDVTKTSAVNLQKTQVEPTHNQQTKTKEPPMNNSREHGCVAASLDAVFLAAPRVMENVVWLVSHCPASINAGHVGSRREHVHAVILFGDDAGCLQFRADRIVDFLAAGVVGRDDKRVLRPGDIVLGYGLNAQGIVGYLGDAALLLQEHQTD